MSVMIAIARARRANALGRGVGGDPCCVATPCTERRDTIGRHRICASSEGEMPREIGASGWSKAPGPRSCVRRSTVHKLDADCRQDGEKAKLRA